MEKPETFGDADAGSPRVAAEGWADLHLHYLPGIDDGPSSFEETVATLRVAYESGSRAVAATPHLYSFVAESLTPGDVRRTFAETRRRLAAAGRRPEHAFLAEMTFHEGAENHLGSELLDDVARGRAVTLNGTRHLLVELPPMLPFEPARRGLETILAAGYVPVLAHVERFPMLLEAPHRLTELVALGCVAQVNAASVAGEGGRRHRDRTRALLDDGLATVVASDGHDPRHRPPDLAAAAAALARRHPAERIRAWLGGAPRRLLGADER